MKKFIAIISIFIFTACQDHHFVPIEKADEIELPGAVNDNGKSFAEGAPPEKFVKTDSYQSGKAPDDKNHTSIYKDDKAPNDSNHAKLKQPAAVPGRLIVSGSVAAGGKVLGKDFANHIIYVTAWNAEKKGPPIAVAKYEARSFPFEFGLYEEHMMLDAFPEGGMPLRIEIWIDGDGDVMTKEKGDYLGISSSAVQLGDSNARVVVDTAR